ncbi:hypothetical protein QR680_007793 [Steinernema hermaphroditum]|uniref:CUB domain-containing protein n=1 Tax=Steinernema hermaphroditum TaxID=289476 RepID=A0AA39IGR3_9BILA|nr:hypothetical protein QR680_007793 [Steinernema hermaphroditum]
MLVLLILLLVVPDSLGSFACPSTSTPNLTHLRRYRISDQSYSGDPVYFLSLSPNVSSGTFQFATDPGDPLCGGRCLIRLFTFSNDETFYLTPYDFPPTPGYRNLTSNYTLFCVSTRGDCNAWIPLWRSVFFEDDGLHYGYSIGFNSVWAALREPIPLCYVWSPIARPRSSNCSASRPSNASMEDHLYTTLAPPPDYRIQLNMSTGYVVVDENSTDCQCLQPLIQVFADNDYFPPNRDHKFVNPRTMELVTPYVPTGEIIYCASEYGACGATVPMRQFFNLLSMDTNYEFGNTPNRSTMRIPSTPSIICYIWA